MLDQLGQLGLSGMAQAFAEVEASDETAALTHVDWLGLLLDREFTHRRDDKWHAFIGDRTYADAILDRLVHNAHRIDLASDSLRRRRSRSTPKD